VKIVGLTVKEVKLEKFKQSFEIWTSCVNKAARTSFSQYMANGEKFSAPLELLKWFCFPPASKFTFPGLALALLEKIESLHSQEYTDKMIKLRDSLRTELIDLMGDNSILLFPSHTRPAPRHYRSLFPPMNWTYTGIFNVLHFPSTQVPLGLNKDHLPLGIQVVSTPGNDHLTIAVAQHLEKVFGGWAHRDF